MAVLGRDTGRSTVRSAEDDRATELPAGHRVRDRMLTEGMLAEPRVVMRNLEASLDVASLEPRTRRIAAVRPSK